MSTNNGPYSNTGADFYSDPTGALPAPVLEMTLTASVPPMGIDIGGGVIAKAEVFNGEIPGPTFRLTVGQTVVVRLVNLLPYELGIHWHGVELENYSDGTEVTQNGAAPAPISNGAVSGGTFLYKFKVPRAGIFWYHPHHGNSINRVFRGLYGMIVVTDPQELSLRAPGAPPHGVLPADTDTMELVLSDITVCKAPGSNDATTYVNPMITGAEWLSGVTSQSGPTPLSLCEIAPAGSATNDDGTAAAASYAAGDVPSVLRNPMGMVEVVEGQTVLTNGLNVGGRAGTPTAPGALVVGAGIPPPTNILSGQGLRLQIVNCAHLRYFRLMLTTGAGTPVNLVRIGGEGGLLDNARLEGGTLGMVPDPSAGPFFTSGELLLPPGGRVDVVAAIPLGLVGTVLTLWTRDCQRTGGGWAQLPSVPVAHFNVTATVAGAAYTINAGDPLRSLVIGWPAVDVLPSTSDHLLPPPFGQPGSLNEEIQFQTMAGGNATIDGVSGMPLMMDPMTMMPYPQYTDSPHIGSTRYAENGKLLELMITNASGAHHPFHLHGFSFQPINIQPEHGGSVLYTWPYHEFRDTIDLLPNTSLIIRVRLDDRPLADGSTTGGAFGRWLFHCHIFFHHMHGMISELVVTSATGNAKPNVNVGGSFEYKPIGMMSTRHGTFHHPDAGANIESLTVTTSSGMVRGTVVATPALPAHEGTWSWSYMSTGAPQYDYVYIEATDAAMRKDQAVFRLQMSGMDTSSDLGDPHIRTVLGPKYDFQAAGEFTLLRDTQGMEIQVRQTPAATPPPIQDDYTQLTECVSLNSAVAARVGSHRISYQPWREQGRLQFFLDGKPADLPRAGMDLDAHLLTTFAADAETGLRIDYAHGPIVTITPHFWQDYGIHYLDVEVTNTDAEGGLMGRIPNGTWLPALPSGATLGLMPVDLNDRYVALYRTFADAWRLTDATSLFVYLSRQSTATFTDRNWPPQRPQCTTVPPGFPQPANPILENIPLTRAKQICQGVTLDDLNAACVFDVASTGDETFAKAYLIAQDLRLRRTAVQIVGDKPQTRLGEPLTVTAIVLPISSGGPTPAGSVTFVIDGAPMKEASKLDKHGRAIVVLAKLQVGDHKIRAGYTPGGGGNHYDSSSSPNLLHTVTKGRGPIHGRSSNCRIWGGAVAILLAALVTALGALTGAAYKTAIPVIAVLLVLVALAWVIKCHPKLCRLLRRFIAGAGLGIVILAVLALLGITAPQTVAVLCVVIVLLAVAILLGVFRKCF